MLRMAFSCNLLNPMRMHEVQMNLALLDVLMCIM